MNLPILAENQIWASRILCLNDSAEFRHGLEAIKTEIFSQVPTGFDKTLTDYISQEFNSIRNQNIFVASWSENSDQLSQWRGYCRDEQGFALGLPSSFLRDCAREHGWMFGRCFYGEENQPLAKSVANEFWAGISRGVMRNPKSDIYVEIRNSVIVYACFMKHAGFKEEVEWRLVSHSLDRSDTGIAVRPSKTFPISYCRFPIQLNSGDRPAGRIIVGPGPAQELASHGAAIAARNSAICITERIYSNIPWRA